MKRTLRELKRLRKQQSSGYRKRSGKLLPLLPLPPNVSRDHRLSQDCNHRESSQPPQFLLPRPLFQQQASSTRPVGPCFHCGETGHLKSSCPHLSKSYPFDIIVSEDSDVLYPADHQGGMVHQQVQPVEASPNSKVEVVNKLPKPVSVQSGHW